MRAIATIIGDEVYNANGMRVDEPSRDVATRSDGQRRDVIIEPSAGAVEEVVMLLARIVRLAQDLSADDARRVREFVTAAQSTLNATTRMDGPDQRVFEAALRHAARQG